MPPERVAEATDLTAVRRLLTLAYGRLRLDASDARRGLRLTQLWVGPVRLDRVVFGLDGRVTVPAPGALVFGYVRSGTVSYGPGGDGPPHRAGDVFLAAQPGQPCTVSIHHAHADLAVVDSSLADQVAAAALGSDQPVRFTGDRAVSAQAARSWKRAYAYLREQATTDPELASEPLIAANAARMLVAVTLTTFPNTTMTSADDSTQQDAAAVVARQAVTFIDEHAGQDISAADIAAAVHVSTRALQAAFRRHLDTTPMSYLRRVRLARVRHQLQVADPATATVTAIASRWGFTSASRFTAYYRAVYGELPSETLRS